MFKLIVLICVVFCLQDILAAPERHKKGLHKKHSSNATVEVVEVVEDDKASEIISEILFSNEKKTFEALSNQADTIGCFTQNLQTEVVNFMRDLSNWNIRIFDDTTNDMISRRNSFVDRINSENVFFLSVITACTSIPGSSLDNCMLEAVD